MNTRELIEMEGQYVAPNYNPLDVVIEKGEGVWVYDIEGKKYMDFLAAYSALNQGYIDQTVLDAMIDQAKKCTLTSRAFRNDKLAIFAKELCEFTGYDMMLPMNTGAEAVETALKSARLWGEKVKNVPENESHIIACKGNFHGRTISIISFSADEEYRKGFGPFTPGFDLVEYGDIEELESKITKNTVAFILEPIQGEAGIIIPPAGYLKKARELCDKHNVLMIVDEIQSGLGRAGKVLACEWDDVKPDMVTLGKALSAGFYPISAVVGSREVLSLYEAGSHGSTYGGNNLACAIGLAAIRVLKEKNLAERSREMGEYLGDKLSPLKDNKFIKEIRGRGLWYGIELVPEAGGARKYCKELMDMGLLCKDTHENTIRLAPPLVITKEEIDWAVERILKVLS